MNREVANNVLFMIGRGSGKKSLIEALLSNEKISPVVKANPVLGKPDERNHPVTPTFAIIDDHDWRYKRGQLY